MWMNDLIRSRICDRPLAEWPDLCTILLGEDLPAATQAEVQYTHAWALRALKRVDEALAVIDDAMGQPLPDLTRAMLLECKAHCHVDRAEMSKAQAAVEEAGRISLDLSSPKGRSVSGYLECVRGALAAARGEAVAFVHYEQAGELLVGLPADHDPDYHHGYAMIQATATAIRLELLSRAEEALARVQSAKWSIDVTLYRSHLLVLRGRCDEVDRSLGTLNLASVDQRQAAYRHIIHALVSEKRGDTDSVVRHLEEARSLYKGSGVHDYDLVDVMNRLRGRLLTATRTEVST